MEFGYQSGKNMAEAEVKLEEGEVLQNGGGGAMPELPQMEVRMDAALLHCQTCLLPLRPPVFQCDAGHIICCFCRAGHGDICSRATTHCAALDAVVATAKVPCRYRAFGCEDYIVFHGAADHQHACQFTPCSCPESGCPFLGTRTMLLDHLAVVHSRLAVTVHYGKTLNLTFSLSQTQTQSWRVLVGEEDKSVFLLSLGALGKATAVSLVCVRADGATVPQFCCKLSVELPGEDKEVTMTSTVGSSALCGGAPAPGQGMFLAVPEELLSGEVLPLLIRIDHVRAAAAPKRAKRMQ